MGTIVCRHCGTEYAGDPDYDQGYRCAATIFRREGQTYLAGHYGSTIADLKLYKVLTDDYKNGTICDDCIQKGLNQGHFEVLSEGYYGLDL